MPKSSGTWSRNGGSAEHRAADGEIGADGEVEAIAALLQLVAFEQRLVGAAVGVEDDRLQQARAGRLDAKERDAHAGGRAAVGGVERVRRQLSHAASAPRERPPAGLRLKSVSSPAADEPTSYPRDLRGYGASPPHARWPKGARIAVQFVLNYEEGGENNVLHGDPTSETFLSELVTAQAYENRHMTMESMYEYGSRAGLWRILREFEARQLPLTVFGVAMALERYPELVERVHARAATRSPATACAGSTTRTCRRRPSAATSTSRTRVIKELTGGAWPLGWYTGRDSPNTRRLVVEHGGYEYDSDYYGDDLPFWTEVDTSDGEQRAAPGRALFARHQRHALRADAGLQHRRPLLQPTCATRSTRSTPRATRPASTGRR